MGMERGVDLGKKVDARLMDMEVAVGVGATEGRRMPWFTALGTANLVAIFRLSVLVKDQWVMVRLLQITNFFHSSLLNHEYQYLCFILRR